MLGSPAGDRFLEGATPLLVLIGVDLVPGQPPIQQLPRGGRRMRRRKQPLMQSQPSRNIRGFPQSRTVGTPIRRTRAGWYATVEEEVT